MSWLSSGQTLVEGSISHFLHNHPHHFLEFKSHKSERYLFTHIVFIPHTARATSSTTHWGRIGWKKGQKFRGFCRVPIITVYLFFQLFWTALHCFGFFCTLCCCPIFCSFYLKEKKDYRLLTCFNTRPPLPYLV